ncbi:transcriptional regulator, AraC family [Shewanella sediminis HAW-EB3]|uniref:Transcriptional regulator, AraC family n=1 Tax=Shewanella sediminis (strain HAW-EB3) TaxID=425104 RepID=A8FU89_SHESH|nr:transcriptional regulator, AraC family [Shewanella sediminis HAW-EB3]
MSIMHKESIQYWHNPILPEVELSRANFKQFEFDRHVHLDYHIGVVSSGCQQYSHRGSAYHLGPGLISSLNPDETHNGQSYTSEGYQVHVMSVPYHYVSQISQEVSQTEGFFHTPLIDDNHLYQAFLKLHMMLTQHQSNLSSLQIETSMLAFTTELFLRHGNVPEQATDKNNALSQSQIKEVMAMFHDDPGQEFLLETLANSVGLSKFQFLRRFKQSIGMTPHAYLKRVRLEYAKKALIKGGNVADIAHRVGFFDQSHLNKAFKQAYLITPAHFQRRVL